LKLDLFSRLHRKENSWEPGSLPPVIFMGLLDTVGVKGFPKLRFDKPPEDVFNYRYEFHDTNVSSEVQHVFQAAATHDRFGPFQPCPVRRSSELAAAETAADGYQGGRHYKGVKYSLREVWYPGMLRCALWAPAHLQTLRYTSPAVEPAHAAQRSRQQQYLQLLPFSDLLDQTQTCLLYSDIASLPKSPAVTAKASICTS
jgi:hypothetical protein